MLELQVYRRMGSFSKKICSHSGGRAAIFVSSAVGLLTSVAKRLSQDAGLSGAN
jgi:hypothetical protein